MMKTLHQLADKLSVAPMLRKMQSRLAMHCGRTWGDVVFVAIDKDVPEAARLHIPEAGRGGPPPEWLERQTLPAHLIHRKETPPESGWIFAPGDSAPRVSASWLESTLLVAATEAVDAVTFQECVTDEGTEVLPSADRVIHQPWRRHTIYSARAFALNGDDGTVRARGKALLVKTIPPQGIASSPARSHGPDRFRRGPYLSSHALPTRLEIGIRNPDALSRTKLSRAEEAGPASILVTAPFLARGGAEHTLFETLNVLKDQYSIVFATLAPHRPELDDRRSDFSQLSPRLYCLGDLVHPDAMPGILRYIFRQYRIDVLYNANSTTLFYDFVRGFKSDRPALRIVDHLYDHEVGYIERYGDSDLQQSVDACIAENHPIAETLAARYEWPKDRAPVVWPCGRSSLELPLEGERAALRQRIRRELKYPDDAFLVLTGARMHEQKRPLDIVALASRLRDLERLFFLIVGGGPLEESVDSAIHKASGARLRRLPFRTDVPELIVAADAGMLVSEFEGLPVFMLECLQLGRPFVGTDVGDLGSVLRSTGAGLVVSEPGDLDGLEASLRRLVDDTEYSKLSAAARTAGPEFAPQQCAERYAEVFFPGARE